MTEDDPEPKRVIDVNEIRDPSILAHGLDRADRAYWLYYDETQNIRRLHLERGTLNIAAPDCWVLGGVGRPDDTPIDLAPLRQRARIQASAEELKFHLFGQKGGDLLDALAKPKMETFLDWVIEQDLLVWKKEVPVLYKIPSNTPKIYGRKEFRQLRIENVPTISV